MKQKLPIFVLSAVGIILTLSLVGCGVERNKSSSALPPLPKLFKTASDINPPSVPQSGRPFHVVRIKYRDSPVDLWNDSFEEGDMSGSSFVDGAWYDQDHEYLVLNLNGTYYHYCSVPEEIWEELKEADSHGSYYNRSIKGEYSCMGSSLPTYD